MLFILVLPLIFFVIYVLSQQKSAIKPTVTSPNSLLKVEISGVPNLSENRAFEIAWDLFESGSSLDDCQGNQYLLPLREIFFDASMGKTQEQKRKIISNLEFDKIGGNTILRKQSNDEKDATIRILEFKPPPPSQIKTELRQAYYPKAPLIISLREKYKLTGGEVHDLIESWEACLEQAYFLEKIELLRPTRIKAG